jgi:type VI secretion system protein ImpE
MDSKELIKANRLSAARKQLSTEVKASPADSRKRTLLFQVLSFFGEWDKAERHLDILAMQNVRAEIGVQVYKNLLSAERQRAEVIKGARHPSFMTPEPPFLEQYFVAWEKLRAGKTDEAAGLYEQAAAQLPMISGVMNGKDFRGCRDVDDFLSGFLEVFIHEQYLWIPFSSLRELAITRPKTLLDLLWAPASLTTWEGLTTSCYLPVIYPDPSSHRDDLTRLGKMTCWEDLGGGFCKGMGQHVFLLGEGEVALLEIRDIQFKPARAQVKK